jgi:hypothetical protein
MSGDALVKVKSLKEIADLFYILSLAHEFVLEAPRLLKMVLV